MLLEILHRKNHKNVKPDVVDFIDFAAVAVDNEEVGCMANRQAAASQRTDRGLIGRERCELTHKDLAPFR